MYMYMYVQVEASIAKAELMEARLERVGTFTSTKNGQLCVEDVKRNTYPLLHEQLEAGVEEVETVWTGYADGRQILRNNTSHPHGSQALFGIGMWSSGVPQSSKHIYALGCCDGGEKGMLQSKPIDTTGDPQWDAAVQVHPAI